MADETEFLNGALGQAGLERITSITDQSVNANWCKTFYEPLRRSLLSLTDWSFAGASVQLNLDATAPPFGYTYAYGLPTSMIKLRTHNGVQVNWVVAIDWAQWRFFGNTWKIEGNKLYSSEAAAFIEYTDDVPDPNRWGGMFYQMFQAWLASQLVMARRQDARASEALLNKAMGVFMPEALSIDAQQHAIRPYIVDDLTWGRNNG